MKRAKKTFETFISGIKKLYRVLGFELKNMATAWHTRQQASRITTSASPEARSQHLPAVKVGTAGAEARNEIMRRLQNMAATGR